MELKCRYLGMSAKWITGTLSMHLEIWQLDNINRMPDNSGSRHRDICTVWSNVNIMDNMLIYINISILICRLSYTPTTSAYPATSLVLTLDTSLRWWNSVLPIKYVKPHMKIPLHILHTIKCLVSNRMLLCQYILRLWCILGKASMWRPSNTCHTVHLNK